MRTFTKIFFLTVFSFMSMMALNAQTTVTWALTADQSVDQSSGTGFTASDQTLSNLSVKSYTTVGSYAAQRCYGLSGTAIPLSYDDTYYEEYTVTSTSGYKLTVSDVSLYLGGGGTDKIYAKILYSIDDFASSTELMASTQLTKDDLLNYAFSSLSIAAENGEILKIRVYTYNGNSTTSTSKYLCSANVTVTFTATTTTGVNSSAASSLRTYSQDGNLVVEGAEAGAGVQVYNLTGSMVKSFVTSGYSAIPLSKGLYLVKVGSKTSKVLVK